MNRITKRLADRRAKNLGLAKLDRQHRCAICLRALPEKAYERFGDVQKYCSAECVAYAIEQAGVQ